ncbi:hypothetical protein [Maritimibacter alkaliphilus]|uniref:hypothetical protein n=1 Tax=Maritimibacter alkaliphilus TaxID=404236 RepID=UPI001C970B7A|nr:hypothetical protein [Maritimibacter alkaliphilus]MBY6089506.1 hypothetical protein [Maritimibacter alkaliphilus]
MRKPGVDDDVLVGEKMAATSIEQKALGLLEAFERSGRAVRAVTIDGRKISLVLLGQQQDDEFDRIDMTHGKT